MRPHTVHAVIAVKNLEQAKSRLADHLGAADRAHLVLAMLADTVHAVQQVPAVATTTVVTPHPVVAATARGCGAQVHPEPPGPRGPTKPTAHPEGSSGSPAGLNLALLAAAAAIQHRYGTANFLALHADLPALRPEELADMLSVAPHSQPAIVIDHTGLGTAALVHPAAAGAFTPRFGDHSAAGYRTAGAFALTGRWPGLRTDVDTATDLEHAVLLGVGAHTQDVLHDIGWLPRATPHHASS